MMRPWRAELPLLVLAVARLPTGFSSSCSGEQCGVENDDDPQSLLSIAARGSSRVVTNLSAYQRAPAARNGMNIVQFRVKNSCDYDVDLYQWGEEIPAVHKFPRQFGWFTIKGGTTTGPLYRPTKEDLEKTYAAKDVRGCENYPGGGYPPGCYTTNHLEFRRSGFGGKADGIELSFDFTGGGQTLGTNRVPNLCSWYGYSLSFSLTAYKPNSMQELACADAGLAFLGGDLANCEKSGGTRQSCTTDQGEAFNGVDGARDPIKACDSPECGWPDYGQGVQPGSIGDCNSKPVAYLRDNYYCINNVDGEVQYSKVNCLCPDPTSDGCNTITGYWAPATVPASNPPKPEPCWYHLDLMQKGKEDGTCKQMDKPQGGTDFATKFGTWFDCIQHGVEADVVLELCPAAVSYIPDPCPIDYPFAKL